MKLKGEIKFKNDKINTNILVDTGASHSFINPKIFSEQTQKQINDFKLNKTNVNSLNLKLFNGLIETVNSNKKTCCIVVTLHVRIHKWRGTQEFIISDEIENEECILGRNFLKKNHVKMDYGSDKISIGGSLVDFESIYLLILENYFFFYLKYLFKKKLINIKRI